MPRLDPFQPGARRSRSLILVALVVVLGVAGARGGGGSSTAGAEHAAGSATHRAGWAPPTAAPALASEPEARDEATDGDLLLEGQVVDADDQPVGGARVTLAGGRSVVTEANGSFAFDDLREGRYDLTAEHGDAFAEAQGFALDASSEPVTLTLLRGPTLIIHVVDPGNRPFAGATVDVARRTFVTPASGTLRVRGVDTDDVYVDIRAEGRARVHRRVVTSEDPAAIVECTIELKPGSSMFGTVVDLAGLPVADAWVQVTRIAGHDDTDIAFSDEHGAWQLDNVAAGRYAVSASSKRYIATDDLAVAHDASRPTTGVVVRVTSGAEISGVVVDATGAPIEGARVIGGSHVETTDERGEFLIEGLTEDTYNVTATTPTQGSPGQDVRVAGHQHVRTRIVLQTSSLAGTVVDRRGEPVEDAMVFARRAEPSSFAIVHSDLYGRFDLGGLSPGVYTIGAQRGNSHVDGPTVDVATGARNLQLVVPDLASVTGRVLLDGAPLRHYGIAIVEPERASSDRSRPIYDASGRFTDADATPGTMTVVISGPGIARHLIERVQVVAGQRLDLGDIAVTRAPSP